MHISSHADPCHPRSDSDVAIRFPHTEWLPSSLRYVAVDVPSGTRRVRAVGLDINMLQNNVSNAFRVFGSQFEISGCVVHQTGACLWPGYGPKSDATPFQPSVTVYFQGAVDGWVHDNT